MRIERFKNRPPESVSGASFYSQLTGCDHNCFIGYGNEVGL